MILGTNVAHAISLLKQSCLVAIPTETVYGLAGNALSEAAVSKIFEVKNRPIFDPLIVHTNDLNRLENYVEAIPAPLLDLATAFMPGPLSILLQKKETIPDIVTAGLPKVAVRIPNHPMTLELLEKLDFPLAAPSANPFGYISPTTARHVMHQLDGKISYILDGGPCTVGLESTIVEYTSKGIRVLRKGGISIEAIERVVGKVLVQEHSSSHPAAPGMLKSHYAPKIPFVVEDMAVILKKYAPDRIGYLAFKKNTPDILQENQFLLSKEGDLIEAARNLFAFMRELDESDLDIIVAEFVPEFGLGRAINDKIRRAAAK